MKVYPGSRERLLWKLNRRLVRDVLSGCLVLFVVWLAFVSSMQATFVINALISSLLLVAFYFWIVHPAIKAKRIIEDVELENELELKDTKLELRGKGWHVEFLYDDIKEVRYKYKGDKFKYAFVRLKDRRRFSITEYKNPEMVLNELKQVLPEGALRKSRIYEIEPF